VEVRDNFKYAVKSYSICTIIMARELAISFKMIIPTE